MMNSMKLSVLKTMPALAVMALALPDFAALTGIPELRDAKLERLKTRIKFADKKPAGAK